MSDPTGDRTVTIHLSSAHDRLERATVLADLAFSDFVNADRNGLKARAVLRIADALKTYERLDAESKARASGVEPI